MNAVGLLTLLLLCPVVGLAVIMVIPGRHPQAIRVAAGMRCCGSPMVAERRRWAPAIR